MQRRDLVDELEKAPYVPGIDDHDFTAGPASYGVAGHGAGGYDDYHHDPFAHAEAYEYDPMGDYSQPQQHGQGLAQPQYVDPEYQYQHQQYQQQQMYEGRYTDHPTQDGGSAEGYADLHRSNSVGSGSGHGHPSHGMVQVQPHRYSGGAEQFPMESIGMGYPSQMQMPMADQYLGRPTGGMDGP